LEKHIPVLSLFAFSRENWARPLNEVEFLMGLFLDVIGREVESLNEQGVSLRFIGDRSQLSRPLCDQMEIAEALTCNHQTLILNIVVNYTGRWDIVQAARTLIDNALLGKLSSADLNETLFERCLSTSALPDPDLLIRTSGEQRISNFYLWQIAFTEFYFTDVKWPDFTADEFERALSAYKNRERRYGLTSKQLKEDDHV
jgi:undecaprenyl diphosphate synthase